jgi:hypothetical protein
MFMANEKVGLGKNQEIDLVLRGPDGEIKSHKKIIFKDNKKSEVIMGV